MGVPQLLCLGKPLLFRIDWTKTLGMGHPKFVIFRRPILCILGRRKSDNSTCPTLG